MAARAAGPLVRARPGRRIHCGGTDSARRRRPGGRAGRRRADRHRRAAAARCPAPSTPTSPDWCCSPPTASVSDATAGEPHESVDPARQLFDVSATGDSRAADVARAFEFGALATAAQLVGAGQAMLDMSVEYAKQRSQFGRVDRQLPGDQAQARRRAHRLELARPLVYGAALSLADGLTATPRATSAPPRPPPPTPRCWRRARRCRPTAPSASPPSTTCRCGCCGCRRCTRPGATRPATDAACWRHWHDLSEERQMLRETVAALVDKHAPSDAVRAAMDSDRGYDESLWTMLCEQVGVAALVVPEELGGAGGELADAAAVLEELGRALVPTPLLGTTLAELALLAADAARRRGPRAAGRRRGDRRGGVRSRLRGQRRRRRRRRGGRRRPADRAGPTSPPNRPTTMDPTRRLARVTPAAPPSRSAPTPAWPTPPPSCWPPNRSAPRRAAWN